MRLLALLLLCFSCTLAAEPFLRPNDVIALLGGQDMVEINEQGELEALLQRGYPDHHLKVRSFAWEGDTVFEQRRDLNYPSLEAQLDKIGATVVIAGFGRMESLGGREKVADFQAAYGRLIDRLGGTKRQWVLLAPGFLPTEGRPGPTASQLTYQKAIFELGARPDTRVIQAPFRLITWEGKGSPVVPPRFDHAFLAREVAKGMGVPGEGKPGVWKPAEALVAGVKEKNRLWFHYTRPQNWAFLAGDRTNQPSSRDHVDKNKRWFPEEMEQFVPLIEAQDKVIWNGGEKISP